MASVPGNTDFFAGTSDPDEDGTADVLFFVADTEPTSDTFGEIDALNGVLFETDASDDLYAFGGSLNIFSPQAGVVTNIADPNNAPDEHSGPIQLISGASAFAFLPPPDPITGTTFDINLIGEGTGEIIGSVTSDFSVFTQSNSTVPEPVTATLALMSLGVLGMATRRRAA